MLVSLRIAWPVLLALALLPTPALANEFEVGQSIILKSSKARGVPIHRKPAPSYWKHIPNGSQGVVQRLAVNSKWLFIVLESGESGWVIPKYVHAAIMTDSPAEQHHPPSPSPIISESARDLHVSSAAEEELVWSSEAGCRQVVQQGGRMELPSSSKLRIGTWNIRWFPYGRSPERSGPSDTETDVPWLTCTIVWMNVDVLAVEESLGTAKAKQAWQTVLDSLEQSTGDSWKWTPQACGKPDSHKIGFLWNASRVELTQVKSLWRFNVKAQSNRNPCEGGLRPGHYAYVQSRRHGGADFHLIAVHLKSGATVFALEDRHRALNRIDRTVSPFLAKDQDIVILGDFNTMGAGDRASRRSELKYMRRMVAKEMPGFLDLPLAPQCSHYFRGRPGWLDHLLVNKGMEELPSQSARVTGYCALTGCRRIKGDYPLAYERLSDHCPIVIDIENQDKD